jgi:hypothetical protein
MTRKNNKGFDVLSDEEKMKWRTEEGLDGVESEQENENNDRI